MPTGPQRVAWGLLFAALVMVAVEVVPAEAFKAEEFKVSSRGCRSCFEHCDRRGGPAPTLRP